jgi:uncharacterized protein YceH (UPF0502 family)
MLRGVQTLGELKTNSHRLFDFSDLDDVQYALQQLMEREPAMVVALPKQPGQKEGRYAHLLAGEPEIPLATRPVYSADVSAGLEARVLALETQVEDLQNRLKVLEDRLGGE